MSYFTSLYKTAIDSLVKGYAESVTNAQKQKKLIPEDLVLAPLQDAFLSSDKFDMRNFAYHKPIVTNIPFENNDPFYDPIRQALGATYSYDAEAYGFGKTLKEIVYPKNKQGAMEGYDANKEYSVLVTEDMGINPAFFEQYLNGDITVLSLYNKLISLKSFDSNFRPLNLYKLHPKYFNAGIQFIEFREPIPVGEESGFIDPLFKLGYTQLFGIHFNYSVYTNDSYLATIAATTNSGVDMFSIKTSLPLTMLFSTDLKNQSYVLPGLSTDQSFGNPTNNNWDGIYLDKDRSFYKTFGPNPGELIDDPNGSVISLGLNQSFGQMSDFIKDYSFSSRSAISEDVIHFFGDELNQNTPLADIKPVYNFVSPQWEKNMPTSEHFIFNIYNYADGRYMMSPLEKSKMNFENYGYKLKNCEIEEKEEYRMNSFKYSNIVFLDSLQSLNTKAETAKNQFPMYNEVSFYGEKPGDIGILLKETGLLVDFIKSQMSYNTTNYALSKIDDLSGDLEDFNDYVYERQLEFINRGIISSVKLQEVKEMKFPTVFATSDNSFGSVSPSDYVLDVSPNPLFVNDFLKWLQYYIEETLVDNSYYTADGFSLFPPTYLLGQMSTFYDDGANALSSVESKTAKAIGLLKFLPKFKEIIIKRMKHIHDLYSGGNIEGDLSYSETIMYEVVKREVLPKGANSIAQKIFIPVSEYSDYIKYIDTQVKYGIKYSYEINEIKMVIGNEYRYITMPGYFEQGGQPGFPGKPNINAYAELAKTFVNPYTSDPYYTDAEGQTMPVGSTEFSYVPLFYQGTEELENYHIMMMNVAYRPCVKIVSNTLYSESDVIIVDNPPLPPLTNIYPISGQKNKILLTLQNQSGDRDLEPVPISPIDTTFFNLVRSYQKRNLKLPDGKYYNPTLRFKSDDAPLQYEIYKTSVKPTSYADFSTGLVYTLDASVQTGIEDEVLTNQKYYYTFRTIDRHQNISNPSPVYEVEMVEDSDITYPIITVMDGFEEEKNYMLSKRFRRYLMIDAADQQAYLNEEESGITGQSAVTGNPPVLGTAEKSLWNDKRFKFRIKSRDSGKVIDLNLSFKTKHILNEKEKVNLCD